ncbi:hypothetical protein [Bacillus sp. Marseille-Q1617]|uniref:hypothetical protein n=1 Tax=Bacillus sp. Marseille-Q1617 TaxID=2736887 RepID=UPI00158C63FE|nr:hypothetical protein [Bacillus sp. Marseille-Q1617]
MKVKPMTSEEFEVFLEKSIISYAKEETRSGNCQFKLKDPGDSSALPGFLTSIHY